jgi:cytochrome c
MKRTFGVWAAAVVAASLAGAGSLALAQAPAGDPVKGKAVFDEQCTACHALQDNYQGPLLAGVVGRKAGVVPGVDYTDAIKASAITWTPDKLDQFLTDPGKMIPGTAMPATVPDPVQRRDLIAYLASVPATGK